MDIHKSKDTRGGLPMTTKVYLRGIEKLGGAPTEPIALTPPACPQHNLSHWGVFQRQEGHAQGSVRTDERLIGYPRVINNPLFYLDATGGVASALRLASQRTY